MENGTRNERWLTRWYLVFVNSVIFSWSSPINRLILYYTSDPFRITDSCFQVCDFDLYPGLLLSPLPVLLRLVFPSPPLFSFSLELSKSVSNVTICPLRLCERLPRRGFIYKWLSHLPPAVGVVVISILGPGPLSLLVHYSLPSVSRRPSGPLCSVHTSTLDLGPLLRLRSDGTRHRLSDLRSIHLFHRSELFTIIVYIPPPILMLIYPVSLILMTRLLLFPQHLER